MSDTFTIRLFLASPGDVLPERHAALSVINRVNEICVTTNLDFRVELYAWEKDVAPELGLPQEVILRQIPVAQCDVFVAVLWTRFGTPPGMVRPRDGQPYLSGTEAEIDLAIDARHQNNNRRPRIMIYHKQDPPPPSMVANDYIQYGELLKYLQRFEPSGEHPALVFRFWAQEFERILERHLLQVVGEFRAENPDRQLGEQNTGELRLLTESAPPLDWWMEQVGLQDNPFQFGVAQQNEDSLDALFVRPPTLGLEQLLKGENAKVVFGKPGTGKTAIRKMLMRSMWPQHDQISRVGLEIGQKRLNDLVAHYFGGTNGLSPVHFVHSLVVAGKDLLEKRLVRLAARQPDYRDSAEWAQLEVITSFLPHSLANSEFSYRIPSWLNSLVATSKLAEFEHIYCLIDQIDELLFVLDPGVSDVDGRILQLLDALMQPSVREIEGITFCYFLPQGIESLLNSNHNRFRLDRCAVYHLDWTTQGIKDLIRRRLVSVSSVGGAPYVALGQLCSAEDSFARRIDDELANLSEQNPRAALWLANRLLSAHCEAARPPRQIHPLAWERTVAEWHLWGHHHIFGRLAPKTNFNVINGRVFHDNTEIELTTRSRLLLVCLVARQGDVCSYDDLIRAGWPNEKPEGVSRPSVTEAMRRLRSELQKSPVTSNVIETVRGEGYRMLSADPTA